MSGGQPPPLTVSVRYRDGEVLFASHYVLGATPVVPRRGDELAVLPGGTTGGGRFVVERVEYLYRDHAAAWHSDSTGRGRVVPYSGTHAPGALVALEAGATEVNIYVEARDDG